MAWKVGQPAVCVEEPLFFVRSLCMREPIKLFERVLCPIKGQVYEVSGVIDGCDLCGGPRLVLAGVSECSFFHEGFRPAVEAELGRLARLAADPPRQPAKQPQPQQV